MVYDNQVPIWVILSKKEVEMIKKLAEDIVKNNIEKIKNPDPKTAIIGKGERIDYNYSGYIAEYAFHKASNSKADFTIGVRKAGIQDGGIDGILPNGIKYDVKSTQQRNGRLLAPKDNEDVDIFVLCIVSEDLFTTWIYGYAWRKELISEKCKEAFQNRPGYWMEKEDLHHFKSLGSTIYEI